MARKKSTVKKKTTVRKKTAAKRRISKKRVGTSQTAVSRATKKKPSARLKSRRSKNTRAGYYPNPDQSAYVIGVEQQKGNKEGFWTGKSFDTDITKAAIFRSSDAAKLVIKSIPLPAGWNIGYMKVPCKDLMRKKK